MTEKINVVLSYVADSESEAKVAEIANKLNEMFDANPSLRASVTVEASAQVLLDAAREV